MRRLVFGLALGVVALVVVACGNSSSSTLGETEQVVQDLRTYYVDGASLSDDSLNQAAIKGILDSLGDPYTSYLPPQQFSDFSHSLDGQGESFEGIGAEVTARGNQIIILGPLPNSPADRAGIKPGDVLLAVDGQNTDGMALLDVVDLIRGPKGSTVNLTILRAGSSSRMDIAVVRDTITVTSVFYRMQTADVGYIRLSTFDSKAVEETIAAIKDLKSSGAKGLILDLRDNSGGLVDAAVGIVSQFVPAGIVCTHCDPTREVSGDGIAYDMPLVVLVNSYSASASEIVAGALQDHGRAAIVGTRTFGKGSVNVLLSLDSGSGLYVTTDHWYTPNGRQIQGHGIDPDIVVGAGIDVQAMQRIGGLSQSLCQEYAKDKDQLTSAQTLVSALDGLCTLGTVDVPPPQTDEQLDVALTELQKKLN